MYYLGRKIKKMEREERREGGKEGEWEGKNLFIFSYKERDLADVLTGRGETNPIVLVQPPLNITDGK